MQLITRKLSYIIRTAACGLLVLFGTGSAAAAGAGIIENIRETPFELPGPPASVEVRPPLIPRAESEGSGDRYFNAYILKAVDRLYENYGLLGYDVHSILTHDIAYHTYGDIKARNPPLTMCVAAQMEVILTAYAIYAEETGDSSIYEYLPKRSFEGLRSTDLKGHIWVNHDPEFDSWGTADALIHFGMGERTEFEALEPGSFVNINRDNATGHAVTFINYIDAKGNPQAEYNASVVGFRYFSSNGGSPGKGGLGYGSAIFRQHGCPWLPGRDCGVIYSKDQHMLNTGTMLSPKYWDATAVSERSASAGSGETVLDEDFFNGVAPDRINPDYRP